MQIYLVVYTHCCVHASTRYTYVYGAYRAVTVLLDMAAAVIYKRVYTKIYLRVYLFANINLPSDPPFERPPSSAVVYPFKI